MTARTHVIRALSLAWRALRVLLIVVVGLAAGWATWSIHQAGHPWPATVLGVVALLGAAKLIHDLTRRSGGTN